MLRHSGTEELQRFILVQTIVHVLRDSGVQLMLCNTAMNTIIVYDKAGLYNIIITRHYQYYNLSIYYHENDFRLFTLVCVFRICFRITGPIVVNAY